MGQPDTERKMRRGRKEFGVVSRCREKQDGHAVLRKVTKPRGKAYCSVNPRESDKGSQEWNRYKTGVNTH